MFPSLSLCVLISTLVDVTVESKLFNLLLFDIIIKAKTSQRSEDNDQAKRVVWLVRADSEVGKELAAVAVSE